MSREWVILLANETLDQRELEQGDIPTSLQPRLQSDREALAASQERPSCRVPDQKHSELSDKLLRVDPVVAGYTGNAAFGLQNPLPIRELIFGE